MSCFKSHVLSPVITEGVIKLVVAGVVLMVVGVLICSCGMEILCTNGPNKSFYLLYWSEFHLPRLTALNLPLQ